MGLGTTHMTVTTAANAIPEIWTREVRRAREANLVFANLVKKLEAQHVKYGDTIHIPHSSLNTARDKSAGSEVTLDATTESKTDVSIDKHKYLAQLLEDITDSQSIVNQEAEIRWNIGYAIAAAQDTDLGTLVSNASVTQSEGVAATDIGDSNIIRGIQYLDDANAPGANRSIVVKPSQWAALMKIDKFVRADAIGDLGGKSPIKTYQIGQIYGIPVYKSTNVYSSGNTNYNVVFHRDAFVIGMQRSPEVKSQYFANYLGTLYVGHAIYGVALLRADHVCQLLS